MATIYEVLRDLFFNPRYSDLEIICRDGLRFQVHRVVISLHSPILDSMVTEGPSDHGDAVSQIQLLDVDFDTFYMVLQFLYGGNYNDYETFGSFHSPSYVVSMTPEEIDANLETLPCLHGDPAAEDAIVDDDYGDYDDEQTSSSLDSEDEDEEVDETSPHGDMHIGFGQSQEVEDEEDMDIDDRRTRTFQGHSLFDSLRVYCVASRFNILPLKLLARDRFYRTAEKVLMFSPNINNRREARWWTHDHQRIYRSKLVKAVFDDFPRAVHELYQTVPESDTLMRAIPPMLIAAGYNNDGFRNHMKPLLEEHPDLALAVIECMRIPNPQE
ncbi:hypothetical protein ANO14919_065440 [Xylariales sp. No.14919]|nr:hypothetical protein ANO14919_065440 [Xylariales sp. No.14919]